MKDPEIRIVTAAEARRALTEGDLRERDRLSERHQHAARAASRRRSRALRALAGPQPRAAAEGRGCAPGSLRRRRLRDGGAELLAQEEVVLADREAQQLAQRFVALRELA